MNRITSLGIYEQYGMGGAGMAGAGALGESDLTDKEVEITHEPFKGLRGKVWMHNRRTGDVVIRRMPGMPITTHIKHIRVVKEDFTGGAEVGTEAAAFQAYESGGGCDCKCDGCVKKSSVKEEYGAGEDASTEAATRYQKDTPGQENAEMPYQKTIRTIKKFMRDKYTKK